MLLGFSVARMSPEKKASEGIALLSMYGDEDDEMEDLDEERENPREEDAIPPPALDGVAVKDDDDVIVGDYGNNGNMQRPQEERGLNDSSTPSKEFNYVTSSASATPQQALFSPQQQQQQQQQLSKKSRMLIVDYGHEEGAMSPEAEDGEIPEAGRVMYGEMLQTSDGESDKKSPGISRLTTPSTQATPPQLLEPSDQPESDGMSCAVKESESGGIEDAVNVSVEDKKDVDPLDKFLPPPPKVKCSEELQNNGKLRIEMVMQSTSLSEKIIRFLALKKTSGRSFNSEVRNRKEYRNPDFLLHAVTYQNIDQIGSCFPKDVFDPHGYDKSDFYDEIAEADMRRETERREQEKKKNQKVDFTSAGVQPGLVIPTPKISLPTPGFSAVGGGVTNVTPATSDVTARDGRQNKKSKWDKVDVDQRNSLSSGGQENLSAVGAHAALISAAKAASGYSAFAQQKRKEAEDKRSSDKRLERRS
ncbi:transcriptional regulator family protein [Striga asiatica]|uniref:Transcriptional regulator family protein n=1 Tax=Striga asiatica TaxID=4170 RepID=A0A5A7NVJ9_STRAF|nr:transcriptional regulator family protein [Striga asiatica]